MSEIALRTYVEQLDTLIERKQIDEVVAHCRHLLSAYPKHLDTYRMLGKALLEKGRHGDAADIFQRVLSVMPDDFIAHVGMSIVREDEANLDAAIWHMERAFEAAPANGAIQQELCRLYGRRDGVVPTKARLTRGALARMYTQGGLFLQAEAELRSALADEPDRIDLLTVLAHVYAQSDQPAQAAQTCAGILQKLPYSLEANRILYAIFRAQGRPDDATVYRQRVEALDPYEAYANPQAASSRRVEANKIMLERLEYAPGMEDTGSPDWLASIGAKFEEPATRPAEGQPAWLNPTPEPVPAPAPNVPGTAELPDWLRELQPQAPAPTAPAAAPDWLRDIGLGTTPLPAQPAGTGDLPDWLKTASGPLTEEAVPAWMRPALEEPAEPAAPEAAPAAPNAAPAYEAPTTAPASGDETEIPAWLVGAAVAAKAVLPVSDGAPPPTPATDDDLPEWMRTLSPPAEAAASNADALPAWMRGPTEPDTPANQPAEAEPQPEWVQARAALEAADATPAPEADTDALPDWLRTSAETSPEPQAMAAATPEAPAPTNDDTWISNQPAAQRPTADITDTIVPGTPAAGDMPAWLRPSSPAAEAEPEWLGALKEASAPETPTLAAADIPDWLKPAAPVGSAASPADEVPAWLREASAAPAAELPDWMKPAEAAAETQAAPLQADAAEARAEPPAEPAADIPAWLSAMAPVAAAMTPAEPEPASPAAPTPTELGQAELPTGKDVGRWQADMPAWLRPAAEAEALPLEAVAPPPTAVERPSEEEEGVPAWLRALPAATTEPPAPPQVPDWLRAVAAQAPSPDPQGLGAPALSRPPVELPDFLQPASPEAIARAERPFELQGDDDEPPDSEPLEADLVVPAELPEWLQAMAPVTPDPEASVGAQATLAAETPTVSAAAAPAPETDETLDWLASLTAQPAGGDLLPADIPPDVPPWAEPAEPGPSDTIATWLAGRSADQAPPPPAPAPVEPVAAIEPRAPDAAPADLPPWAEAQVPGPTDTIIGWLSAKDVAAAQPPAGELPSAAPVVAEPAPLEPSAAPDLDGDEAMRWLESLAARQGANADELLTAPEDRPTETPAWIAAEQAAEQLAPAAEPAMREEPALAATPAEELPDWLRALEPAAGQDPIEPAFAAGQGPVEPMAAEAPEVSVTKAVAESELDGDEALRWLEGLAARQGASADELLTRPEDRPTETPAWIAAEQAAELPTETLAAEPVAEVEPLATATPPAEMPDWLRALEPAAEVELPALATAAAEPVAEVEPLAAATPPTELPDWLRALEPAAGLEAFESLSAQAAEPAEDAIAPTPADELPSWLRALEPAAGVESIEPTAIEPPVPADMPADEIPDWLRPEAPPIALTEAVPEPEAETETPSWLAEALGGAGALVGAGALAVASVVTPEPEPVEPTVPVANEAALESWLSAVEAANPVDPLADTAPRKPRLPSAAAPIEAAPGMAFEAPAAAGEAGPAEPEVEALDADEAMRWLEGLAAQQGANPEELLTAPEERPTETPAWIAAEQAQAAAVQAEPVAEDEPTAQPTPYNELPDWLPETLPTPVVELAAAEAMVEPALLEPSLAELAGPAPAGLEDTGPSRAVRLPTSEMEPQPETPAQPGEAMSEDEALRWLESLAVRQGANPEELLTAPDERPTETPAWIVAEQATAAAAEAAFSELPAEPELADQPMAETVRPDWLPADAVEPTPPATISVEPAEAAPADVAALDEDQAMRWLEGLAAQQGANPEELLTAPDERPTETPAWIAAEQATAAAAAEAALEPEPVAEPEPAAAITPPTWLIAEEAAPETATAGEPLSPELEAALAQDDAATPPAARDEPLTPVGTADLGKLSRLSERLANARRARESEIEARFAEQRAQQEAARREVEERMGAWRDAMEAETAAKAAAAPGLPRTAPLVIPAAPAMPNLVAEPVITAPPVTAPAAAPYVRPHAAPTAAPRQPAGPAPDYAAALARLAPQVDAGADLTHTIRELEGLANAEQAPAPVLRLLGDAYAKANRLPHALDAFRQALSKL